MALLGSLLLLGWLGTPENRRPRLLAIRAWISTLAAGDGEAAPRATDSSPRATLEDPAVWIHPADLAGATPEDWGWPDSTDERWAAELGEVLASTAPFQVDDVWALLDLRERFEALSFVRSVASLAVDRVEGLYLALELRRPVACVPAGATFMSVDDEGVLLSGTWPVPIRIEGVPLPVIGPVAECASLFAYARPGDWLVEPEHLDALEVALSLAEHLDDGARQSLGRFVIDASEARLASVEEPGVRLLLEERRLVLFGRRPMCGEPGELDVAHKWDSLRLALETLDDPRDSFDWDVVDVRWDQPSFVQRGPSLASGSDAGRGQRGESGMRGESPAVGRLRPL